VPRHDPPRGVSGLGDDDRVFFADFKDFADVVNWWLADEFTASRFRLQDLPDTDVSLNVDHSYGPTYGRCFAIYHNQTRVGRLEIYPLEYRTESPEVRTNVQIDWSRFFDFGELTDFLWAIAMHVTSQQGEKREERITAGQTINSALTKTMWDNYRVSQYDTGDDEDWGELNVSFQGTADFYIARRDAPARVSAAGGNAARNERSEKSNVSDQNHYKRNTAIVLGGLAFLILLGFILTKDTVTDG
jgi:hypothetical protein